jgi:hypothetical protein
MDKQPTKKTHNRMSEDTKYDRRRFIGAAAMSIAATTFGGISSANAQSKQAAMAEVQIATVRNQVLLSLLPTSKTSVSSSPVHNRRHRSTPCWISSSRGEAR